jgi:hypothetical protein
MAAVTTKEDFGRFLAEYTDSMGRQKYYERIAAMIPIKYSYLPIEFVDLLRYNEELAELVIRKPDDYLEKFDLAANETVKEIASCTGIQGERKLRASLRHLPLVAKPGSLTEEHLSRYVSVCGFVDEVNSHSIKIIHYRSLGYRAIEVLADPELVCGVRVKDPLLVAGVVRRVTEQPVIQARYVEVVRLYPRNKESLPVK